MADDEPVLIDSPLSRTFTCDGITVEVCIYSLDTDPRWVLEVVNENRTSTVWEDYFETDEQAYAAFLEAVEEDGMLTFLDDQGAENETGH